jgi:zinc/manganese transport system substrate-binding protein
MASHVCMRLQIVALLLVLVSATSAERLPVACATSVLADMATQIGGDRIRVLPLVPAGGDAHTYQPGAAEAQALGSARMVVINGLGFEGWFDRLAAAAGFAGSVVVASVGVTPRQMDAACGVGEGQDHTGHDHTVDPHAWLDLANGQRYAENIRDGLIAADPAGTADYRAWTDAYLARLRALDGWTRRQLAAIPAARRVLVTNHDAAGYFAAAYGFTVRAPATALDETVGGQDLARLAGWVREQGVPAVFLEHAKDPRLVARIAEDAGVALGGTLYLDGVPADGLSTYEGMFLLNVRRLVAALQ